MLEFDDIQHILVTRTPALTGRYEFLTFRDPAGAQAWLGGHPRQGAVGRRVRSTVESDNRWVTVAFTWNGLRALGVDEALAGHLSRGVQAGHGGPGRDAGRHRGQPSRTTGWVDSPAPTCMPS